MNDKKMRFNFVANLFLVNLVLVIFIVGCQSKTIKSTIVFDRIGFSFDGSDKLIVDKYKNNKILAHKNETLYIISLFRLNKKSALNLVLEKNAILNSQYEARDSSYPGEITKEIVCPREFKPIENIIKNGNSVSTFQVYATQRLTYGVCAEDLIFYKSFYGFFYCYGKGLFQIEIFVPKNDSKSFYEVANQISSFAC